MPEPSGVLDAVNQLSAFADRTAWNAANDPENQTRKRVQTMEDACRWILKRFPMNSTKPPPAPEVSRIVRQAQGAFGPAPLVRSEPLAKPSPDSRLYPS